MILGSLRPLRDRQPFNPTVDEWEIDPREGSLGVEIGQGAFGRVLTGYYRDKEIAIKVLRGRITKFLYPCIQVAMHASDKCIFMARECNDYKASSWSSNAMLAMHLITWLLRGQVIRCLRCT